MVGESAFFKKGWVTLSANFTWKGTSPINVFLYQKTRLNTLSCGVKISTVPSFVSSQCIRVTDGQNYDPQDSTSIAALRGKMWVWPWARGAPQNLGSSLIFLQQLKLATSNLVHSLALLGFGLGLPRPVIKSHPEEKLGCLGLGELSKILGSLQYLCHG